MKCTMKCNTGDQSIRWQSTSTNKKQMPVAWTKRPVPAWINIATLKGNRNEVHG